MYEGQILWTVNGNQTWATEAQIQQQGVIAVRVASLSREELIDLVALRVVPAGQGVAWVRNRARLLVERWERVDQIAERADHGQIFQISGSGSPYGGWSAPISRTALRAALAGDLKVIDRMAKGVA